MTVNKFVGYDHLATDQRKLHLEIGPIEVNSRASVMALGSLWRKRWSIAILTFFGGLTAALISGFSAPSYTASTLLLVKPYSISVLGYDPVSTDLSGSAVVLETQAQLLRSPAQIEDVANFLLTSELLPAILAAANLEDASLEEVRNFVSRGLVVRRASQAEILQISFTSTDPEISALVPNASAEVFLEQQRSDKAAEINRVGNELEKRVAALADEAEGAMRAVAERANELGVLGLGLQSGLSDAERVLRSGYFKLDVAGPDTLNKDDIDSTRQSFLAAISALSEISKTLEALDNAGVGELLGDASLATLQRDAEVAQNIHRQMLQRLQEVRQLGSFTVADARVVSPALPPSGRSNLGPSVSAAMGAIIFLILGSLIAVTVGAFRVQKPTEDEPFA